MQDVYEVEVRNCADPPAVIATLSVSQAGSGTSSSYSCQRCTAQNNAFCEMLESPQDSWQPHRQKDSVPSGMFSLQRSAEGAWSVVPRGNKYIAALIAAGLISLSEKVPAAAAPSAGMPAGAGPKAGVGAGSSTGGGGTARGAVVSGGGGESATLEFGGLGEGGGEGGGDGDGDGDDVAAASAPAHGPAALIARLCARLALPGECGRRTRQRTLRRGGAGEGRRPGASPGLPTLNSSGTSPDVHLLLR